MANEATNINANVRPARVVNKVTYDLLERLTLTSYYGNVELKFESGKVVIIKKTETIKP